MPLRTQAIIEANQLEGKLESPSSEDSDTTVSSCTLFPEEYINPSSPSSTDICSENSNDSLCLVPVSGECCLKLLHTLHFKLIGFLGCYPYFVYKNLSDFAGVRCGVALMSVL